MSASLSSIMLVRLKCFLHQSLSGTLVTISSLMDEEIVSQNSQHCREVKPKAEADDRGKKHQWRHTINLYCHSWLWQRCWVRVDVSRQNDLNRTSRALHHDWVLSRQSHGDGDSSLYKLKLVRRYQDATWIKCGKDSSWAPVASSHTKRWQSVRTSRLWETTWKAHHPLGCVMIL